MAKKKTTMKKVVKKASKTRGGRVGLFIGFLLVVCLAVVYFAVPLIDGMTLNQYVQENYMGDESDHKSHNNSTIHFSGVVYDEFQIHFLELGNWNTGDSIFIKAGDNDILIDAGSKYNSAESIENFVDQYCKDGTLEYVIATHAHEDHIAGFSGGAEKNGIFYKYKVGTIIEFPKTDSSSAVLNNYVEARNYAVSQGAKCYTALECYQSNVLSEISLGTNMSMKTLYHKYYEQKSSTENNYSVCTLFTYNNQHYLFTGDLESAGESSLADSNPIPKCELYKAGHHGSNTSSSEKLMLKVQPKVVCCCCCCGSDEYSDVDANQFPTQEFIDRVGIYTSNIYVTSISTSNENRTFASMNGYICFSSNGTDYSVTCSNNDTVLKDTDWFKKHRTWPNVVS